jgi:hypothetical protein
VDFKDLLYLSPGILLCEEITELAVIPTAIAAMPVLLLPIPEGALDLRAELDAFLAGTSERDGAAVLNSVRYKAWTSVSFTRGDLFNVFPAMAGVSEFKDDVFSFMPTHKQNMLNSCIKYTRDILAEQTEEFMHGKGSDADMIPSSEAFMNVFVVAYLPYTK